MIGQIVDGRYRVLRLLGRGGMGAVYEAEHAETGKRVAIKVIHAEMATKTEMVMRFQREAKAAGSIKTPHIVQVLDAGTDPGSGAVYMIMEMLQGEDLNQVLQRLGKLPPLLALRLVGQACTGLGKAHEAGVIHRDIKPANLFLSRQDGGEITVKVVDFGIAKIKADVDASSDVGLTTTGHMIGSPRFMSPEQAMGRKTIDHRTDIWSLGVVLYQALTGRTPHEADTAGALIMAICSEPAAPIQDPAPWVPPEIARIVHRMLAIKPDARFQTVAELLEAIRPLVPDGLSVREDALITLPEAEEARTAPRAILDADSTASLATTKRESRSSGPTTGSFGRGEAGLSISQSTARTRVTPAFAALALSVSVIGGAVAYNLVSRPAPPSSNALSTSVSSAPAPLVTSTLPPEERSVRFAVEPPDATVEIDGRPAPVNDGSVELRGAIGTVHHVRLVKGSQETKGEVAITAQGAIPPKVQIEAPPAKRPTNEAHTAAPVKPAAAARPRQASTARPADLPPATDFQ